jgi:hypothetical protein
MPKRKIIQILKLYEETVTALCSDGALWEYDHNHGSWDSYPELPQDKIT